MAGRLDFVSCSKTAPFIMIAVSESHDNPSRGNKEDRGGEALPGARLLYLPLIADHVSENRVSCPKLGQAKQITCFSSATYSVCTQAGSHYSLLISDLPLIIDLKTIKRDVSDLKRVCHC